MPFVRLLQDGQIIEQEVKENSNLVVLAGTNQFPKLRYGCGMGKCTKCVSKIVKGEEALNPPNWKEEKMLGHYLEEGYRLACQLTVTEDLELIQEKNFKVKGIQYSKTAER
ncbi:Ferredoxin [Fictibacillus solisalsi]|uniref:Ferredoxin n=1 Tax=Fictibacillus solisalsi TaxID=459525 RepID=A0A1G9TRG4_9BACL|nr:2Fe-2S iron-sulfur cluster-binding protein [Fictibacillus solisalsi]SDM50356.1 Ferredoxin [Fictibacillus solisalsi]